MCTEWGRFLHARNMKGSYRVTWFCQLAHPSTCIHRSHISLPAGININRLTSHTTFHVDLWTFQQYCLVIILSAMAITFYHIRNEELVYVMNMWWLSVWNFACTQVISCGISKCNMHKAKLKCNSLIVTLGGPSICM